MAISRKSIACYHSELYFSCPYLEPAVAFTGLPTSSVPSGQFWTRFTIIHPQSTNRIAVVVSVFGLGWFSIVVAWKEKRYDVAISAWGCRRHSWEWSSSTQFPTAQGRMMFRSSRLSVFFLLGLEGIINYLPREINQIRLLLPWSGCYQSLSFQLPCPPTHIFITHATIWAAELLINYDLPQTISCRRIVATTYWQGQGEIIRLHCVHPRNKDIVADKTTTLKVVKANLKLGTEQIIVDRYDLVCHWRCCGKYQLEIGMYDWRTGERLKVIARAGTNAT
jgi:hypothetical protein